MHKLIIGSKDINDIAILTNIDYPLFSYENIYVKRANNVDFYKKRKENSRLISLTILLKDNCSNVLEIQSNLEKLIETRFKSENPIWINLNDRYFYGILESVNQDKIFQGLLTLTYRDLLGNFYSEEKEQTVSSSFTINTNTVKDSNLIRFELTPQSNTVNIKVNADSIFIYNQNENLMVVDFLSKTIKQNNIHVRRRLDSTWGALKKQNTIQVSNSTGTMYYREVIA